MTTLKQLMRRERTCSSGFTLVETLVAISILLVVIVGPMTIASRGMQNSYFAGDQTTAVYLAQEAMEHIQGLRDDVALQNFIDYREEGNDGDGDTWSWYVDIDDDCTTGPNGCDVDFENGGYRDCGLGQCVLNQYIGDGNVDKIYSYESVPPEDWVPSPFTRRIRMDTLAPGIVAITVTVEWSSNLFGGTRTIALQTYLYDRYVRYE